MAEDKPVAISVQSVSKDFKFSTDRADTLKSLFTGLTRFGRSKPEKKTKIQHALKDISFEVKEGEFFGIVGRNGSGKSTLLKILAGIYQPNKGKTYTRGRLVPFIELGVGFNPELTGKENVYLNGALLNFSQQEIDKFYDEVVEFAELEPFMDKKLKNYSSGMQVRLAFSMAIRARADILLIDEVLAVGDADFQRKCYNYFKTLKRNKQTVVFISHDMDAIRQFCDRAILINDGVIQKMGNVSKVAAGYTKLFMDKESSSTKKTSDNRWGESTGVLTQPKVVVDHKKITVKGSLAPKQTLTKPILGFVIKDATGAAVLGANTKLLHTDLGDVTSGKQHEFVWEFQNILADGEYVVDLALVRDDGVNIIEWWSEAQKFTVKKSVISPYAIWPDFTVKIT